MNELQPSHELQPGALMQSTNPVKVNSCCNLCMARITIIKGRSNVCPNCKTNLAYIARNYSNPTRKINNMLLRIAALTKIKENPKIGTTRALRQAIKDHKHLTLARPNDMNTTFYYAWQPEELLHLRQQCTIWLPEDQSEEPDIWSAPQIVATCRFEYLQAIMKLIKAGTITPGDVIWIEVKNKTATGYIFGPDGQVSNFFRII